MASSMAAAIKAINSWRKSTVTPCDTAMTRLAPRFRTPIEPRLARNITARRVAKSAAAASKLACDSIDDCISIMAPGSTRVATTSLQLGGKDVTVKNEFSQQVVEVQRLLKQPLCDIRHAVAGRITSR